MAQNDLLKRYLDAGMQFTLMTQQRAEAIVRDLVKAGELQTEQAQAVVTDLVDRSRRNSEKLVEQVREEVRTQVSNLGLATKADITRLEQKINGLKGAARSTAKRGPAKKSAARKSTARRSTAKKSPAKKSAAKKKAAAKKSAAGS
ncbi:hypothetical protein BH24ACT3_BH24ACT3_19120 [soil metagenome]